MNFPKDYYYSWVEKHETNSASYLLVADIIYDSPCSQFQVHNSLEGYPPITGKVRQQNVQKHISIT